MRLSLFQPDIAGNVGTMMRLCACFGLDCDIIEPCGFAFGERALRRSGMDYAEKVNYHRHADWDKFCEFLHMNGKPRIIAMSSKAATPLHLFKFRPDDVILMGRESAGLPEHVHAQVDERIIIPMQPGFRSLNVAVAASMAMFEAMRQTDQIPNFLSNNEAGVS
ncbi:rRNA methyltransferase [Sphingorhabdus lutea]|uniref:tRNA (cytidine(34)-2'-O)-methyltransferase n=1 Tax=Sphingorhabdus lutea TaxID=1913578 RepID=A0A1L3JAZ2_9SPHN|nr:tRNA (cytidine(34)-2'-O)-methyltransferase [Sphingorhabdus lutea]APG62223.1 rRNA methyltransferase [Sphingorhabdus lutea]